MHTHTYAHTHTLTHTCTHIHILTHTPHTYTHTQTYTLTHTPTHTRRLQPVAMLPRCAGARQLGHDVHTRGNGLTTQCSEWSPSRAPPVLLMEKNSGTLEDEVWGVLNAGKAVPPCPCKCASAFYSKTRWTSRVPSPAALCCCR